MPRYIDADELENKLRMVARMKQDGTHIYVYAECLAHLKTIPTADVAPMAGVAREIFAEIESKMVMKYYVSSQLDAYREIRASTFDELKKKYGVE